MPTLGCQLLLSWLKSVEDWIGAFASASGGL